MKDKNLQCQLINLFCLHKHLILFCLILFISVKPFIKIVFDLFETINEFCEVEGKEESKEKKEKKLLKDDKDMEVYFSEDINSEFYSKQNLSFFEVQKYLTDYNPEILLPPPRKF